MSLSDIFIRMAKDLCKLMDTEQLIGVTLEYSKRVPNEAQELIMDTLGFELSKRLPYDEFRKVMIQVNEAIDNQGSIFHKGDTKQGD